MSRALRMAVAVGLLAGTVQAEPSPRAPQLRSEQTTALRDADVMVHEIDRLASSIRLKLRHARAVDDLLRAAVLNDQVNQADVASRRATEARGRLVEALSKHQDPTASLAAAEIANLRLRVRRLVHAAPDAETREAPGVTRVIVLVDPRIPQAEPTR